MQAASDANLEQPEREWDEAGSAPIELARREAPPPQLDAAGQRYLEALEAFLDDGGEPLGLDGEPLRNQAQAALGP